MRFLQICPDFAPRPTPSAGSALCCVFSLLLSLTAHTAQSEQRPTASADFAFTVVADMRSFVGPAPKGKRYFDGACEAMAQTGAGAFMIVPGDCEPPAAVRKVIDRYLGADFPWYPVVGNHDTEKAEYMEWLRAWAQSGIPNVVRLGPPGASETMYSFDFGNSHFVVLNQYFDGTHDAVRGKESLPEITFDWLQKDLAATDKPLVWVVGHRPVRSLPDMDTGRVRHKGESVSLAKERIDRFVRLLKQHRVRAYLCGHTHNASVARVSGIWQLDAGHARGAADKGAPSTFMKVRVLDQRAWVDVYRANPSGSNYSWKNTIELR